MEPSNFSLGPIRELMADPDVTEVMINGPDQVFVERHGVMELNGVRFADADELRRIIEVLLRPTGRSVSSATPYADFRLAELVRNSLRMRPTRIIVGETRGPEAVDMLQAISSGHEGCLAVLHASTPIDAVSRLENPPAPRPSRSPAPGVAAESNFLSVYE